MTENPPNVIFGFLSCCFFLVVEFNPWILSSTEKVFHAILWVKKTFSSTIKNVKLTCITKSACQVISTGVITFSDYTALLG